MSEPELPETTEPISPEADSHEHGEHSHEHEGDGVLKTTTGCGKKCEDYLVCKRRTKPEE